MKYFLIENATGDSKVAGKAMYDYNTKNEVASMFHKKLGTAMGSELYTTESLIALDEQMNIVVDDNGALKAYWVRKEEPTAEVEN